MSRQKEQMTDEVKKKISNSLKGNIPWNKGKSGGIPWNKGLVGYQVAWNKDTKGVMKANCTSFKKGMQPWNVGIPHSEQAREKNRIAHIGRKHPPDVCKKISESHKGDKSYSWKGGITSKNAKIRNSPEYKVWRKSVFERDDYTCLLCGDRGGVLHADHIKKFSLYPSLRLDINNGRTLCVDCHKKTDTYLSNSNSKKRTAVQT